MNRGKSYWLFYGSSFIEKACLCLGGTKVKAVLLEIDFEVGFIMLFLLGSRC